MDIEKKTDFGQEVEQIFAGLAEYREESNRSDKDAERANGKLRWLFASSLARCMRPTGFRPICFGCCPLL